MWHSKFFEFYSPVAVLVQPTPRLELEIFPKIQSCVFLQESWEESPLVILDGWVCDTKGRVQDSGELQFPEEPFLRELGGDNYSLNKEGLAVN